MRCVWRTEGILFRWHHTFPKQNWVSRPRTTLCYPTVHGVTVPSSWLARYSFENSVQCFFELKLCPEECRDLRPLLKSALNNAPSPQRGQVSQLTAFTGLEPQPPFQIFIRTDKGADVTIKDVQEERLMKISSLKQAVADLHPVLQKNLPIIVLRY